MFEKNNNEAARTSWTNWFLMVAAMVAAVVLVYYGVSYFFGKAKTAVVKAKAAQGVGKMIDNMGDVARQ